MLKKMKIILNDLKFVSNFSLRQEQYSEYRIKFMLEMSNMGKMI